MKFFPLDRKVYMPLFKVADTPFHIQVDGISSRNKDALSFQFYLHIARLYLIKAGNFHSLCMSATKWQQVYSQ